MRADASDVEHDWANDDPGTARPLVPSLPPRLAPPPAPDELWQGVQPELQPPVIHHADVRADGRRVFQFRTAMFRVLNLVGWLGGVATSVALVSALIPQFRDGEPNDFIISPSADVWFGTAALVSSFAVYLGWFAWSTLAAFNARKLNAMTTNPLFPIVVYVGGPILAVFLAQPGPDRAYYVAAAIGLFVLAHMAVIASIRSTAGRIGGSTRDFTSVLVLPIGWVVYRFLTTSMVAFFDGPWHSEPMLVSIVLIESLFPLGIGLASWRGMTAFDRACERNARPMVDLELPAPDLVAAALRRRVQEGR